MRDRITSGVYPPGTLLPTRAELGREHGTTDETVGVALRTLEADGLLEPVLDVLERQVFG